MGKDSFDARMAHYDNDNLSINYEERDGKWRTWRDLSPQGRLAYIARDAVLDGVSFERFVLAAQHALAELPPAAREQAALRLVLHGEEERYAVEQLLPPADWGHDLAGQSRPLAERVRELIGEAHARPDATEYPSLQDAFGRVAEVRQGPETGTSRETLERGTGGQPTPPAHDQRRNR